MALFGAATLAANAFWIALFLYVGGYNSIRSANNPSPGCLLVGVVKKVSGLCHLRSFATLQTL